LVVEQPIVVIPTYNEIDNIGLVIEKVLAQDSRLSILVVDDNSPDGTSKVVEKLAFGNSRVGILNRPRKEGLGKAYREGLSKALELGADVVIQMDADLSHPPELLPEMLRNIETYDLVTGSRYLNGVNVVNWPIQRLLMSWFGNLYARRITGVPISDLTGGFRCTQSQILRDCGFEKSRSSGYAFQIELNYRLMKSGARNKELGFVFVDRSQGDSKLSSSTVREAIWIPWWLRLKSLFGTL
jgi:dolichol-phosphate mannosyltransferase